MENNVSEELNLYQQESKSCALSIKLETPTSAFPGPQTKGLGPRNAFLKLKKTFPEYQFCKTGF